MKYHLLILVLTLSALCYAKDNTKDFIKLIKKHDVPQKARELNPEASPAEFWTMVLDDNSIIANLVKDISKGKGAEKDALAEINRMKLMDYRLQVNIIPEFKGYCDIADDIVSGKTTLKEFEDYLAANNMERTTASERLARPFGDVCYDFVSAVVNYMEAKPSIIID